MSGFINVCLLLKRCYLKLISGEMLCY